MNDSRVRILLADDHLILRKNLAHIITREMDLELIGEASDGQEAIDLARQLRPQVIIMDVCMPRVDGVEATRVISADFPEISIIGLSMCCEMDDGNKMRQAGALDYVSKTGKVDEILAAIRKAARANQIALAYSQY